MKRVYCKYCKKMVNTTFTEEGNYNYNICTECGEYLSRLMIKWG